MTGGRNYRERQSEAEVMQHYIHTTYPELINPIQLEDRSRSTAQNLMYSQLILEQQNISQNDPVAIAATSDFHSPRAQKHCQTPRLSASD